jgi:hypothetical protein
MAAHFKSSVKVFFSVLDLIVLPKALPRNRAFGSFTFVVLNLNPVSCQETCNCDFLLASVNIPLDVTPHSIAVS